ncbi:SusC/RagA family TonB-linked outer membrane protein [Maribacter ulvicola]|uniref:Iron complex outermembrane recepter protein n=1 Tax=Maribacter ulvicola TaxID=228959 RepID=A0A1N7AMW4_9FLAO|nr:SusC/RagA family TonB-linked outer membrane protein [Maribacter ulvicola]SIR40385.1 iron complex outermembrane recepter protein [Maribacter ulvicola]
MELNSTKAFHRFRKRCFTKFICAILILSYSTSFGFSSKDLFQNVEISIDNNKNIDLPELFELLREQAGYRFVYSDELVAKAPSVKLTKGSILAKDLLYMGLAPKGLTYEFANNKTIIVKKELLVQTQINKQLSVSGTVVDDQGMPLPGVNVVEKGTTNGTYTDFDGNFEITVSNNASLMFSALGFKSVEQSVNGRSSLTITMQEDAEQLGEVVVTALGIKREQKALGYAMTEVKGEELAETNTVNPVAALQGKAAGVSIGGSDGGLFGNSKIQIRGVSTLNSNNNQPIFVIDGVILDNSTSNSSADWSSSSNDYGNILKNLNPDDYKSISILKGAAATALYGSRGINGVVLIESKDGANARGIGVSITHSLGFDRAYDQPALQNEFGEGTLAGYVNYGETDANGNFYRFDNGQFYNNSQGMPTVINHAGGLGYGPRFDGRPIEDYDGNTIPYSPSKTNMLDVYDTGVNSNTSVALSGGNEKGNFYLSDSYNLRKGIMPDNSFRRNSLLLSGSYQLAPWLKANASISFTNSSAKNPRNDISQSFFDGNFQRIYNTDKYTQQQYWQAPHGGLPSANYSDDFAYVPNKGLWFGYYNNDQANEEQVTRPVVRLTANVTDWLTIAAEGNMNHYTVRFENKELGSGYANEGGYYELQHREDISKTGKLTFNFTPKISDNFTAQVLVGGEIWNQEKSNTRVRTDGGLIVPGRFYLDNSKRTKLSEGGISATKQINSLYFLSSFGYKDQLFLDLTGRNDWSSALVYTNGEGNYSYFYPSVSTSWVFSETFAKTDWFTFGKLRASWAQVGSDTSPYSINKGYGLGTYELPDGNFVYKNSVNSTTVDRDIKPERKNSFEVGADVRFFSNRLGVDLAYYNETINNQIGSIPLPSVSGYSGLFTNIGSLSNYGVELSVTGTPVRTANFEWNTTFNYWNNTTKIKEMHEDLGEYKGLGGAINYGNFRIGSVAYEGGEYGVLYSDITPKLYQATDNAGNPIDDANNGKKVLVWSDSRRGAYYERSYEVEEVGKIQPDFEGSFNNEFNYKGLSLSVLLDARFGGNIASYSSRYGTAYGYLEESLRGRDAEYGGVPWTSQYGDTQDRSYVDGIIPDGVFADGQEVTAPNGSTVDVGGMTYQEAYDAGHVEPTHASFYNYFTNSWGQGVVNDDWFNKLEYIAIRNVSLGYNLPKAFSDKLGARNFYIGVNGRNLGYLHNSLPNNINPESFRGTTSDSSFLERSFSPYVSSYTMTVKVDF